LLNSRETLDYLIKKYIPHRKSKSVIYNFPDFVDVYDRYYGNENCTKKNQDIICFMNACRHGTVADIIRYSKTYDGFNENIEPGFLAALEDYNFAVADYIYANHYNPWLIELARATIVRDPTIEKIKWFAKYDKTDTLAHLLVLGTLTFDSVLWLINFLNDKDTRWFDIQKNLGLIILIML
jgi:hypothetical protein